LGDDNITTDDAASAAVERVGGLAATLNARTSEAETLVAQLAEARKAHATTLVGLAVSRGAVLQEHAESRVADMVNAGGDFAAKAAELASLPPLMKTVSATTDVADRNQVVADRRAKVHEMVNAALPNCGGDYDKAFARVRKQHPELFGE
jgi:hypothetical protein